MEPAFLPEPGPDSAHFWDCCRTGRLMIQVCAACGAYQFYPRSLCSGCLSDQVAWHETCGSGRVYAHTIVHRAPIPKFERLVPYVVAMIELDEGVRLISHVVGCPPGAVRIGMRVAVAFERLSEEIHLPVFRSAEGTSG